MKLKGISALEQHVEKIVLGVMGAVLLGVVATQFLFQPNQVQVGKDKVPVNRAYQGLESEAQNLLSRMRATDVPLPDAPEFRLEEQFTRAIAGPLSARAEAYAMTPTIDIHGKISGDGPALTQAAELSVPAPLAPTEPIAYAFSSTLDPFEVARIPELVEEGLVPAQQPYDKAAVSVQASFSGRAYADLLAKDPDGDGPIRAMPSVWWRSGVEMLSARLERQQLNPDGSWSEIEVVPSMPGRLDLLDPKQPVRGMADLASLVDDARRLSRQVQRPGYYRLIAGPEWFPPEEASVRLVAAMNRDKLANERAKYDQLLADKAALEEELSRAPDTAKKPDEKSERPPSDAGGGGKGGGGVSGGGGRNQDRQEPRDENKRQRTKPEIEREIKRNAADLERSRKRLTDLGENPDVRPSELAPDRGPGLDDRPTPLLAAESVRFWAHDISGVPGETYRYRLALVVSNPVFGRGASMVEAQKPLAGSHTLVGEASPWSNPVTIDRPVYYFITSASEADDLGSARATAEVFQFHYGYYRVGRQTIEPGDIVAAELALPAPELRPLFDVAIASPPSAPGREPPPDGGGGKGGAGVLDESGRDEPDRSAGATLPPGSKPGPKNLAVSVDALLLGVARAPAAVEVGLTGQSRAVAQAYIRDSSGQVVVRNPDAESASVLYGRVELSARIGATQGEPPKPKVDPKRPPGEDRRRDEPRPPRDQGGGGGGGGGG